MYDIPEIKTPETWCKELGAEVVDPDGWRNEGRNWEDKVTRAEFDRLLNQSTINSAGYPGFLDITTFIAEL